MAEANSEHYILTDEVHEIVISEEIEALEISEQATDPVPMAKALSPFQFSSSNIKMRSDISINFPDIISTATCSELVIELIKYILYLKEQIPYQYNRLKLVVDKKKQWDLEKKDIHTGSSDKPTIPRSAVILAEKHFTKSSQAVEALEKTFKALRHELPGANAVALLLGATIASPQEAYVVELPPLFTVPQGSAPSRGCLAHLIRELVTSESIQKMTSRPTKPSNIYIMLKKPSSDEDSWFEMKPLFSLPTRCHQLSLKFLQPSPSSDPNFTVFQDRQGFECPSPMCTTMDPHIPQECPCDTNQWFQAQNILKGFKDCWIGEESATDIWMKV